MDAPPPPPPAERQLQPGLAGLAPASSSAPVVARRPLPSAPRSAAARLSALPPLPTRARSPSPPPYSPLTVVAALSDMSSRYPSPSLSSSPQSPAAASPTPAFSAGDPIRVQMKLDADLPPTSTPPPSQNDSAASSPSEPPAKRRRIAGPRPRTTQRIDLSASAHSPDVELHLDRLTTALRKRKKIVVIAGAGISVSAGIPDFRSSKGLFTTLRGQHRLKSSGQHLFDASVYRHASSTSSFHDMVRELADLTRNARPTPFHHMLASLAAEGRLLRLYSQNVDGIDTAMPPLATAVPLPPKGPWPATVQLHGGLEKMVCSKCNTVKPFDSALFTGPDPPLCDTCREADAVRTSFAGKRSHGIGRLRPRIVLYNEFNPDEEAIGNVVKADMRRGPDAVIVVGTTLKIPGVRRIVKEMCQLARSKRGGITAWLNIDGEPQGADFKDCWDFVVKGSCDDIAELVALPRWDEQDIGDRGDYMVTGNPDREARCRSACASSQLVVPLPASPPPTHIGHDMMPTPGASPKLEPAPDPVGLVNVQGRLLFSTSIPAPTNGSKKNTPAKKKTARKRNSKSTAQTCLPALTAKPLSRVFLTTKNLPEKVGKKRKLTDVFSGASSALSNPPLRAKEIYIPAQSSSPQVHRLSSDPRGPVDGPAEPRVPPSPSPKPQPRTPVLQTRDFSFCSASSSPLSSPPDDILEYQDTSKIVLPGLRPPAVSVHARQSWPSVICLFGVESLGARHAEREERVLLGR